MSWRTGREWAPDSATREDGRASQCPQKFVSLHDLGSLEIIALTVTITKFAVASAEKIRLTELSNRRSKGAESHALNALKVTVGKVLAPEDNLSRARRRMNCS
ncbi:hypothetical protein Bbelb_443030 [Branchiostoma belcheri]|nr:hypothetical protein Bbelb_443030 [Branchiostoma belcheri]